MLTCVILARLGAQLSNHPVNVDPPGGGGGSWGTVGARFIFLGFWGGIEICIAFKTCKF